MSPADAAKLLAGLNWSGIPLSHQLAASAALETLNTLEPPVSLIVPSDADLSTAHLLGGVIRTDAPSNVIPLPIKPRTCWTTICHLDGRQWATSSHFGPAGAWGWILDCVMEEHGVSEDQVGGLESGEDDPYDGDDLVTIDGLPVYRIQHFTV